MKRFALVLLPWSLSTAALADAPQNAASGMKVIRSGSVPSEKGEDKLFTGSVRLDPLFGPAAPSRISSSSVTFEPGAHTHWHVHPAAQMLIVTVGTGWVDEWGKPVQKVHAGDVVVIPAGTRHWHGATATTGMTHIAIQEVVNGKVADVVGPVTAEDYRLQP